MQMKIAKVEYEIGNKGVGIWRTFILSDLRELFKEKIQESE